MEIQLENVDLLSLSLSLFCFGYCDEIFDDRQLEDFYSRGRGR